MPTRTVRLHRVLRAPPEMCYLGCQEPLVLPAQLVQAEIPEQ